MYRVPFSLSLNLSFYQVEMGTMFLATEIVLIHKVSSEDSCLVLSSFTLGSMQRNEYNAITCHPLQLKKLFAFFIGTNKGWLWVY